MDVQDLEAKIQSFWESNKLYKFLPQSDKEIFSIDTPPPYVSAAHLHVGHAMSYAQAEIIVRFKRMCGFNVFYPMGFDDNGLPTERYVEKTYKIDKKKTSRAEFRKICIEETLKGAAIYKDLWNALGLSVDWDLSYSTIDERCRKTAQAAFIKLYEMGRIKRVNQPVLWDTALGSSLAQADLESMEQKGTLYDIAFDSFVISTTRPEMLPACVALFCNPSDDRYSKFIGQKVKVPLFNFEVPIFSSPDVDLEYGTGLMMVCTFGDGEDVKKWKEYNLETRLIISEDGKLNELAGDYNGLSIEEARKRIVSDLGDAIISSKTVDRIVSVGERSQKPVEFLMASQWLISTTDMKDRWKERSEQLNWHPEWMKKRLDQWVDNLKYDWNISRQRFYGVPFPAWYVLETGNIILADEADLPIDPTEQSPPSWAVEKYKGYTIVPDSDVMDTWMTSSLTPLINGNWADKGGQSNVSPMSLRVQGFEIIRTWLFYTLVQSDQLMNSLPWSDVMISGWGLNEGGKKISKRDLTDNKYDPYAFIKKYGADALRLWAANSQLGHDLRFHEKDVKDGKKIVTKLFNVCQLVKRYIGENQPKVSSVQSLCVEDQWILAKLNAIAEKVTQNLNNYDYATAKDTLVSFFMGTYCDDYLELVKVRFWENYNWDEDAKESARFTLFETLKIITSLFAPFIPFVTEHIYQEMDGFGSEAISVHVSNWPANVSFLKGETNYPTKMDKFLEILYASRQLRSELKMGPSTPFESVSVQMSGEWVRDNEISLLSILRANSVCSATEQDTLIQLTQE